MAWGIENKGAQQTVSLSDLRAVVMDRLQTAERRLDPASASAAFARANDNDSGQDSLIGSLLLGMLLMAPLGAVFGATMGTGIAATLNGPFLTAALDGLSMVWDEKARKNRRRHRKLSGAFKDGLYHGGRRQSAVAQMKKRFNVVSANENARYSYDAGAEVAGMSEILDILDGMEKNGVTMLSLDGKKDISQSLRAAAKPAPAGAMHRQPMAMRKAI